MRTTAIAAGGRPEERAKMVSRSAVILIFEASASCSRARGEIGYTEPQHPIHR
jgi:hypothetical protein